jgi:hypothetical protein
VLASTAGSSGFTGMNDVGGVQTSHVPASVIIISTSSDRSYYSSSSPTSVGDTLRGVGARRGSFCMALKGSWVSRMISCALVVMSLLQLCKTALSRSNDASSLVDATQSLGAVMVICT